MIVCLRVHFQPPLLAAGEHSGKRKKLSSQGPNNFSHFSASWMVFKASYNLKKVNLKSLCLHGGRGLPFKVTNYNIL